MIRDSETPIPQSIGDHQSMGTANTYFYRVPNTFEGFDAFLGQISIETKFVKNRERDYIRPAQIQIYIYFTSIGSIGSIGNPKNHRVLCSDALPILKGLSSGGVGRGSTAPAHPWVILAARRAPTSARRVGSAAKLAAVRASRISNMTNEFMIRDSAKASNSDGHLAAPSNGFLTFRTISEISR